MSFNKLKYNQIREKGIFFTDLAVSKEASRIIDELVNPDIIFEPFVGDGSLIKTFDKVNKIFIINDMNPDFISKAHNNLKEKSLHIFNMNFITTPVDLIIDKLNLPKEGEKFIIYSNPPFGTASTNRLAMNKSEKISKSRSINIEYDNLEEYGKGDLVIPSIGKMIKVLFACHSKDRYLAFFSPFGIFCGRKRYQKLLKAILRDFEFLFGKIFPGNKFQNVSKNKPISFSLWKLKKSANTDIGSLFFNYEKKNITLRRSKLLNEYWRYDTRKFIRGEIVVQGNDRFNVIAPKMMHLEIKKGGSELVPENVKKSLNIDHIPDELLFGLWSCAVGHRSLTSHPLYMDNAYVHLPDFSKIETQEILIFTLLSILITELNNNYTKDKIKVFDDNEQIEFGGDRLTQGVNYLIQKYQKTRIGNIFVRDFMNILRETKDKTTLKRFRPIIKKNLEDRLERIDYWGFIPIPDFILN